MDYDQLKLVGGRMPEASVDWEGAGIGIEQFISRNIAELLQQLETLSPGIRKMIVGCILYGSSYAGNLKEGSDIDIALIVKEGFSIPGVSTVEADKTTIKPPRELSEIQHPIGTTSWQVDFVKNRSAQSPTQSPTILTPATPGGIRLVYEPKKLENQALPQNDDYSNYPLELWVWPERALTDAAYKKEEETAVPISTGSLTTRNIARLILETGEVIYELDESSLDNIRTTVERNQIGRNRGSFLELDQPMHLLCGLKEKLLGTQLENHEAVRFIYELRGDVNEIEAIFKKRIEALQLSESEQELLDENTVQEFARIRKELENSRKKALTARIEQSKLAREHERIQQDELSAQELQYVVTVSKELLNNPEKLQNIIRALVNVQKERIVALKTTNLEDIKTAISHIQRVVQLALESSDNPMRALGAVIAGVHDIEKYISGVSMLAEHCAASALIGPSYVVQALMLAGFSGEEAQAVGKLAEKAILCHEEDEFPVVTPLREMLSPKYGLLFGGVSIMPPRSDTIRINEKLEEEGDINVVYARNVIRLVSAADHWDVPPEAYLKYDKDNRQRGEKLGVHIDTFFSSNVANSGDYIKTFSDTFYLNRYFAPKHVAIEMGELAKKIFGSGCTLFALVNDIEQWVQQAPKGQKFNLNDERWQPYREAFPLVADELVRTAYEMAQIFIEARSAYSEDRPNIYKKLRNDYEQKFVELVRSLVAINTFPEQGAMHDKIQQVEESMRERYKERVGAIEAQQERNQSNK